MKVYLERENKNLNLRIKEIKVDSLLEQLKINKSTVLVVRNDELVAGSIILKDKDEIRILSVISGG